ncbi:MAG: hypothetical protein VX034_04780 [Planctomycetota bacterium]|nr:hypothetical protein [Planctomycetota bacterium]MEC8304006.1 hypothetical protein [Planctomycetota bacterium]
MVCVPLNRIQGLSYKSLSIRNTLDNPNTTLHRHLLYPEIVRKGTRKVQPLPSILFSRYCDIKDQSEGTSVATPWEKSGAHVIRLSMHEWAMTLARKTI